MKLMTHRCFTPPCHFWQCFSHSLTDTVLVVVEDERLHKSGVNLMATRIYKYRVVELSENWTGTSVENSKVAILMGTELLSTEVAAYTPKCTDIVVHFAPAEKALSLTTSRIPSPSRASESYHCAPTRQEVDAYIDSLEFEVIREGVRMRQRRGKQPGDPELLAVRPSSTSVLCWFFVTASIACVWWLSQLFN